jgi:hypothetical protein
VPCHRLHQQGQDLAIDEAGRIGHHQGGDSEPGPRRAV